MSSSSDKNLLTSEVKSSIENEIRVKIARELPAFAHDIVIEKDFYDRLSIMYSVEVSIEGYEVTKKKIMNTVAKCAVPAFQQYLIIELLVMQFDVYDDKVAISGGYIERANLFVWYQTFREDDIEKYVLSYC